MKAGGSQLAYPKDALNWRTGQVVYNISGGAKSGLWVQVNNQESGAYILKKNASAIRYSTDMHLAIDPTSVSQYNGISFVPGKSTKKTFLVKQ